MDYKVEAGNLSDRVKGEVAVIVVASSTVVAKKTWDAITGIAAPAPEGRFVDEWTRVTNITTGEYAVGWELPLTVNVGDIVQGQATAENTGTSTYSARVIVRFINPNGDVVGETVGYWRDFAPGDYYIMGTMDVELDLPGNWKVEAILEAA